ncbi:MAG: DNA repair protein RecN [Clostridiales bacterium]|nr:DNA repair protein RecN [Clostridiales bacterium]
MLTRLTIRNIALIDEIKIDFRKGLYIITGETGAGKSILIDSISLALGERASIELIKHGESKAIVEATFDISSNASVKEILGHEEIDYDDDTITVSREISIPQGNQGSIKSVCRINGLMTNISVLKSITEHIVDLHGQHEHQALLNSKRHIGYLDSFAAKDLLDIKADTKNAFENYKKNKQELLSGFISEQERERRIDMLTYQINEIDSLKLEVGEEEKLVAEREILANGEHVLRQLNTTSELLTDSENGALYAIKEACRALSEISKYSDEYNALFENLNEVYYSLEASTYSVRDFVDSFSFDLERLEEIEARLHSIGQLKRKYGNSIPAVLGFLNKAQIELENLVSGEARRIKLNQMLEEYREQYFVAANKLSEIRKKSAEVFSISVMKELAELGLEKAKFSVRFDNLDDDEPHPNGIDEIEFMLSTNPGEPEKPLSKVASGGEVSRIMLALKSVLANCEDISLMIFDEIDTGISGNTAMVVGEKMHSISKNKQIIAITHLPQIAAFSDYHYSVTKLQTASSTSSMIRLLSEEEHCKEIARILGGAAETSFIHAASMIKDAKTK